ncbi:MAG: nucleoside monophosphate kinase [Candidatus Margulisbacteria bacterium]|nr:nucleoside monophosphate kinase [Candidatus Margulisiibacteriota bacterium]
MKKKLVSMDTTRSLTLQNGLTFSTSFSAQLIAKLNARMSGKTIVFIGGPAAGKGTKIEALNEIGLNFQKLSTGDALRAAVKAETADGLKAYSYMKKGENVPDDIVNSIVVDFLKANNQDAVFLDGYPRKVEQANFLINKKGTIFVIDISVSKETALAQAKKRRQEFLDAGKQARVDDEEATVIKRYEDYEFFKNDLIRFMSINGWEDNVQVCESNHRNLSIAVDTIVSIIVSWFMFSGADLQ